MSSSFTKSPPEQYWITVAFCKPLPPETDLASVTVTAWDQVDLHDATQEVVEPMSATVDNDQAKVFVKAGTHGHAYTLRFLMPLTPGVPVQTLEEDVVMVVWGP
jgi:hypothetical protein